MTRVLSVVFLMCFAAGTLRAADGEAIIERLWGEDAPKARDIVRDAERDIMRWLNELSAKGAHAETHFGDGIPYLVEKADERTGKLTVRRRHKVWDDTGTANYLPMAVTEEIDLADWPSRYAIVTLALDKNPDDKAVAAYAIWLYDRKTSDKRSEWCGNRAMTVLYERTESLQDVVKSWVDDRDFRGKGGELEVCKIWDPEFRKHRNVLLTEGAKDDLVDAKEKQARREFQRLQYEFKNKEMRRSALVDIVADLIHFKSDYAGTKEYEKVADKYTRIREDAEQDLSHVKKCIEEGRKLMDDARSGENEGKGNKTLVIWKDAALKFREASLLDPTSYSVLTHVATAWLKAGNPHYSQGDDDYTCTYTDCIKLALPYWHKLTEIRPGDSALMMNLGLCYQVLGKHSEADKIYTEIVRIDGSGGNGGEASKRIRMMQNPGEKRAEREERRRRKEEKARKDAEKEAEKGGEEG